MKLQRGDRDELRYGMCNDYVHTFCSLKWLQRSQSAKLLQGSTYAVKLYMSTEAGVEAGDIIISDLFQLMCILQAFSTFCWRLSQSPLFWT